MNTVFLTGGTGFVGSHVARLFLAERWQVRALVRRADRPGLLPEGVERVPGELADAARYRPHLRGCTAVVHAAGLTRARRPAEYRQVNVGGTESLVRAASETCPEAMFVHVSSQAAAGPARCGAPVREGDPPAPVSAYGRSKLESEGAVAAGFPGPWCVVRPSIVYGPGDPGLHQMFVMAARGVAPVVTGGPRRVQLVAAEDLARVVLAAARDPRLHRRRGFVAADTVTQGDLAREVAGLRTPPARTVPVPAVAVRLAGLAESLRQLVTRRARPFNGDKAREMLQPDWLCDSEPFLRDVGVHPGTTWRAGLRATCRWYVQARWLAPHAFAGV